MATAKSAWAIRFTTVTFILGGIAWLVIAVLLLGNVLAGLSPPNYALGPAASRIVAGGGPGTWFVMGLLSFLLIGIAGLGFSALFYQQLEVTLETPVHGWKNWAAWIHLILGSVGAAAASLLMTYEGFLAGAAYLPTNVGGAGQSVGYIHTNFLGPATIPIAALMGVALLGYLAGGIALGFTWLETRRK